MARKLFIYLMFMMLMLGFLSPSLLQINAEEEYLIVRVLDAEYPPRVRASEQGDYTLFSFTLQIQIENPTQSVIQGPYVCSPIPFPRLQTNLENKSLEVSATMVLEGTVGNLSIQPGNRNESKYFGIHVENYVNESLPLGVYELWFDFTNCSYVPVPVVTEKMFIFVTPSNITYYFEYNDETRVVSPSLQETNFSVSVFISFFIVVAIKLNLSNRFRKDMKN
ncbi:MAG: hypothetical protein HGN29_02555 [Asgard group archaeon]|nr:hypothetical protein [Asgard group archaeon]